ncbi:MAG: hypothetical protein ACRCYO_19050, partial [Bacteroidia bacterium]
CKIPVILPKIKKDNRRTIVFVGEFLPPRTARIAKWLKRTYNDQLILVCYKAGFVPHFVNEGIEQTLLYRNVWHLKRILRQMPRPDILHSFAPTSRFPDAARETLPDVTFVHDMQDVYATYYGINPEKKWLQLELPHEKNCLALADGVIGHSLEPNIGFRRYGIKKKPPTLFFPLYCDDDSFAKNTRKISDTEIHLVYAGGVAGSHRDPKHYGNIQFHKLIETLTVQGFHFHIYPSPSNVRADYEEYETLAKQNERFHFHNPVKQELLAEELSQYHFGLLPFFKELSQQSDSKLKYATTLKLFNYLEAGIPILVSSDLIYQSWLIERMNVGLSINIESIKAIRSIILTSSYSSFQQQTLDARAHLSLKNNIHRIHNFYKKITG